MTFLVVKGAFLFDIHYPGETARVFRDTLGSEAVLSGLKPLGSENYRNSINQSKWQPPASPI